MHFPALAQQVVAQQLLKQRICLLQEFCYGISMEKTRRPGTNVRNLLVPRVVQVVNPDILLLQETKTDKLINNIIRSTIEDTNRSKQEIELSREFYMQINTPRSQKMRSSFLDIVSRRPSHSMRCYSKV